MVIHTAPLPVSLLPVDRVALAAIRAYARRAEPWCAEAAETLAVDMAASLARSGEP